MVSEQRNTIFDEEISALEKRRASLEAERAKLLEGQVTVQGLDGNIIELDLGTFATEVSSADSALIEQRLKQALVENPLVGELITSRKKKQELLEELSLAGQLPRTYTSRTRFGSVLIANNRVNFWFRRKSKLLYNLISSPWLVALGLFILLYWGGGVLLFAVSGGALGGEINHSYNSNQENHSEKSGAFNRTPSNTASVNPGNLSSLKGRSPVSSITPTTSSLNDTGNRSGNPARLILFVPSSPDSEPPYYKVETTPTVNPVMHISPTATGQFTPGPGPEASPDKAEIAGGEITPTNTETGEERVGNPPSSAGGFNGPHGAFLAPSRLVITALNLDVPIQRALTQEASPAVVGQNSSPAPSTGTASVGVSWPRAGEVYHFGVYPGEQGNMLIMGNQRELGLLRRLQQNDEITVYDRRGNAFVYRVLAFSPEGQPERVVDPIQENWIFAPTEEAILTILVTMPQPLSTLDSGGKNSQSNSGSLEGAMTVTPRDDYLSGKKLVYRAVLARYAPAQATPIGTPVAVPPQVWATQPAPMPISKATPPAGAVTPTPTGAVTISPAGTVNITGVASSTITPSPSGAIPSGLPHTGEGGGTDNNRIETKGN